MELRTALIIPDCHIPWHDEVSYQLMVDVALDVHSYRGIDEIVILGDFLDFYHCALHPKLPEDFDIEINLSEEIHEGVKKLKNLREDFPEAKIIFIEGNHCFRLNRYLTKKCPELFDFLKLEELLHFKEYGIKFIPYTKYQTHRVCGSNLLARHEPLAMGKNCATGTLNNAHTSLIFGHTHRVQMATDRLVSGEEIEAISLGWLGDPTQPVFAYVRNSEKSSQAFAIASILSKEEYFVDVIKIKNHRCIYNGFIYG